MKPTTVAMIDAIDGTTYPQGEVEQFITALREYAGCKEVIWGTTSADLERSLRVGAAVAIVGMSVWQKGGSEVWQEASKYGYTGGVIVVAQQERSWPVSSDKRGQQEIEELRRAVEVLREGVTDYVRYPLVDIEAFARWVQQCGNGLPYTGTGRMGERATLGRVLAETIQRRCAQQPGTQDALQWSRLCADFGQRRKILHKVLVEEVGVSKEKLEIYGRLRVIWPALREFPEVRMNEIAQEVGFTEECYLSKFCHRWLGASPRAWQQWMREHGKIYEWRETEDGLWLPCLPS
jgi:AraC-like DNA-binding protein